jgi:hypothetical protein
MATTFDNYSTTQDREKDPDNRYLQQLFHLIAIARRRGNLAVVCALQVLCFEVVMRQAGGVT